MKSSLSLFALLGLAAASPCSHAHVGVVNTQLP